MLEDDGVPEVPATQQPIDADHAPDPVDTEPTEEDGEQDVDQEPNFDETETDTDDEDDPEIREVD